MKDANVHKRMSFRILFKTTSYFLLFALLCNILYIPCYLYIQDLHIERSVDHHSNNLTTSMQILDASIESTLNVESLFESSGDPIFRYTKRSHISDKQLVNTRDILSAHFSPYAFLGDVGIVKSGDLLLNRYLIFYERDYLDYSTYFHSEQTDYLNSFSSSRDILPETHFSITSVGEYDAITFYNRLSRLNDMYVFVHYPTDKLMSLFCEQDVLEHCRLAIFYNDTLLLSNFDALTENYKEISVDSNSALKLKVVLQLPNSYLERDLAPMKTLALSFISLVLCACFIWIILFGLALSKPFNRVITALVNTGYVHGKESPVNTTEFLVSSIQQLGNKISDYDAIIQMQKERTQIHLLEKAINRGLYAEETHAAFHDAFPNFPKYWQLASIQYAAAQDDADLDIIQVTLFQHLNHAFDGSICLPLYKDTSLVLLPTNGRNSLEDDLAMLCTKFETEFHLLLSYTISKVYDNPVHLAEAYQHVEHDYIALQQGINAEFQNANSPISMQQLQSIYFALQSCDEKAALSILQNSTHDFLASKDIVIAKLSYQALVYTLLQIKLEYPSLQNIPIPAFKQGQLQHLFEVEFPLCFHQITSTLAQQRIDQQQTLEASILEYIDANYSDQQLSITSITSKFGISAPTLQKRMNACVGKTFSAYVEEVRMNKARQAIIETQMSIQDIAESVGYTSTNSFYKAYRRSFGESPRSTRQNFE